MSEAVVNVKQGKLKGKTSVDYAGRTFYSFQGIPYAKTPLGELRFKDPQPAEPWDGVRDATKEGSVCYQFNVLAGEIQGQEDCLFLNVYTPQISGDSKVLRPVMFWIHGGGFFFGTGNSEYYGPEYLVAKDVVLVTFNYRLGILGFLKLEDPSLEVPGNAGLKDMVLALRWVKENIHNFSGDPNNITIFGNSAGSASVHYLLFSPLAKGLFHKAILQSGCVFNQWAKGYHKKEQYAQALDLKTTEETVILQTLRRLPVEKLYEVQAKLNDRPLECLPRPYGPAVEKTSSNAFLDIDPKKATIVNEVPILIGYNEIEGIFSVGFGKITNTESVHKSFQNLVPYDFNIESGSAESNRIAQKIKDHYYKDKEPSLDTLDAFVTLESDVHFVHGIQKSIDQMLNLSKQPIFLYKFCFDGKIYFVERNFDKAIEGASHADELSYLFTQSHRSQTKPEEDIDEMIKKMTKIWSNFARYGNPNPNRKSEKVFDKEWKPVAKGELHYVNIDKHLSTGVNPDAERIAFWDNLYENHTAAKFW